MGLNLYPEGQVKQLVNLGTDQLNAFLSSIEEPKQMADVILIDTGAGATDNIVKMILAAHEVVLIVTPEPTAITDAYALTKIISSARPDMQLQIIINKAESVGEARGVIEKFTRASERFLGIKVKELGFILEDAHVSRSIKEQVPYVLGYPKCKASKQMELIARRLSDKDDLTNNRGMTSYIRRFISLFKLKDGHESMPSNTDEVG